MLNSLVLLPNKILDNGFFCCSAFAALEVLNSLDLFIFATKPLGVIEPYGLDLFATIASPTKSAHPACRVQGVLDSSGTCFLSLQRCCAQGLDGHFENISAEVKGEKVKGEKVKRWNGEKVKGEEVNDGR